VETPRAPTRSGTGGASGGRNSDPFAAPAVPAVRDIGGFETTTTTTKRKDYKDERMVKELQKTILLAMLVAAVGLSLARCWKKV
jgi:hypothetical protein